MCCSLSSTLAAEVLAYLFAARRLVEVHAQDTTISGDAAGFSLTQPAGCFEDHCHCKLLATPYTLHHLAVLHMQALALTNTGTNPLQLAISHAHSNQQQLELTAQLLPVCSSMPQLLSSSLQLEVVANTARRAIAFAEWLRKYGDVLNSLDLDAAVDCCTKDARDCSQAVAGALSTAANTNQVRVCWRVAAMVWKLCVLAHARGRRQPDHVFLPASMQQLCA